MKGKFKVGDIVAIDPSFDIATIRSINTDQFSMQMNFNRYRIRFDLKELNKLHYIGKV